MDARRCPYAYALRVLFPRSRLVNALNRHRRIIGVTACIYGLLHFSSHILYEGDWDSLLQSFTKPFIWLGFSGLTILVVLALTSNQWSLRKLGGKNWKRLHRLAYVAAALLIYHQAIAGKGHWYIARWLFFTLATLELARLAQIYLRTNLRQSRDENPGAIETIYSLNPFNHVRVRDSYCRSGAVRRIEQKEQVFQLRPSL